MTDTKTKDKIEIRSLERYIKRKILAKQMDKINTVVLEYKDKYQIKTQIQID